MSRDYEETGFLGWKLQVKDSKPNQVVILDERNRILAAFQRQLDSQTALEIAIHFYELGKRYRSQELRELLDDGKEP